MIKGAFKLIVLCGFSIACAKVSVSDKGGPDQSGLKNPGSEDSQTGDPDSNAPTSQTDNSSAQTLYFKADSSFRSREIDITWVIDNSGSMKEEIEHVRKNIKDFISYVSSFSSLETAVISKIDPTGYDGNLVLDVSGLQSMAQFHPIDHLVHSLDALFWASKFMCKESTSCPDLRAKEPCKDSACDTFYKNLSALGANSLLRETADKVLVFVTDDESTEMTADRFNAIYKQSFPDKKLKVFSFVTLSKQESPCGFANGEVYKSLSKQSGGKAFNICDLDWRPHFEEIANALEKTVKNVFTVGANRKVLKVTVDGQELAKTEFTYKSESLSIQSPKLLEDSEVAITVSH